jgi:hypothetical protein
MVRSGGILSFFVLLNHDFLLLFQGVTSRVVRSQSISWGGRVQTYLLLMANHCTELFPAYCKYLIYRLEMIVEILHRMQVRYVFAFWALSWITALFDDVTFLQTRRISP